MRHKKTTIANWGNYPQTEGTIVSPEHAGDLPEYIRQQQQVIARGNGRCYGDAASGETMVSTLRLNHLIHFDEETGIMECESGMLLADLLPVIIPKGWFFTVTPGTKLITVGGAIAADVHGKNHVSAGCFSRHLLSFQLLNGEGQILTCSPETNTELFRQTCGGMGWTGIILSARFRLMRIVSTNMIQETCHAANLKEMIHLLRDNGDYPYSAAWMDGNSARQNLGNGTVFYARHEEKSGNLEFIPQKTINIPFFVPNCLLNRHTIKVQHWLYKRANPAGIKVVSLEKFFYPLDRILHWNRLYGRRGFIQYQFCVPDNVAEAAIKTVLETISKSEHRSFLSVLKRHGERPPEAVHSFPEKGFSLALDFPRKTGIFDLISLLDKIILENGGKIYLAKDACSAARLGRIDPFAFGEERFMSAMRERIRKGWG